MSFNQTLLVVGYLVADGDGGYQTEDVFMSRDQFEKLPEFAGF